MNSHFPFVKCFLNLAGGKGFKWEFHSIIFYMIFVIPRYIEGLEADNTSVSNWQRNLSVKEDDIQLDAQQKSRLPGHWLANGPGPEGDLVKSLWKLRDMMMQDSIRISKSHYV